MNSRQVRLLNSKATGLIGTTPGITRNWNYLFATCYLCLFMTPSKRTLTKHAPPPPRSKQSENRIPEVEQQQSDLCVWSQKYEWSLLINLHAVQSQRNKTFPCQILVMFCCLTFRDTAETVRNWIVNWIIVILAGLKPLSRKKQFHWLHDISVGSH